jgi:hypothetical protein
VREINAAGRCSKTAISLEIARMHWRAVDEGPHGATQSITSHESVFLNLYELWNGSKFNAANFFTNSTLEIISRGRQGTCVVPMI